jgi:hypothetical protein
MAIKLLGDQIADAAIDSAHITTGAVDAGHLAADVVDGSKMADNAVDSEHINTGAIDPGHLAALAVTTAKIAADAVDGTKIADDAINSEHLAAGGIDAEHMSTAAKSDVLASKAWMEEVVSADQADPTASTVDIKAALSFGTTAGVLGDGNTAGIPVLFAEVGGADTGDWHIANGRPAAIGGDAKLYRVEVFSTSGEEIIDATSQRVWAVITCDGSGRLTTDAYTLRFMSGEYGSGNEAAYTMGEAFFLVYPNVTDLSNMTLGSNRLGTVSVSKEAAGIATGQIGTGQLAADAVTGAKLADAAVDSEHITTGAIDSGHLAADVVDGTKLADAAVDSEHITTGAIDPGHMAALAIETAAIAALAVTTAKIAADAIDGTKLADAAVDSEHITTGAVDPGHLAALAVETAKIAALAVTTAKIAADAIDGTKLADNAVDSEHITAGAVDTAHLGNLQVTTAKIAADAIDGTKLADDAVDSEHLAAGSIDEEHFSAAALALMSGGSDLVGPLEAMIGGFVGSAFAVLTNEPNLRVNEKGTTPDMSVDIASGDAYDDAGTKYNNASLSNVAIGTAPAAGGESRYDVVVMTADDTFAIRVGTETTTGSQVEPSLSAGDIKLAVVLVTNGNTSIVDAAIFDHRRRSNCVSIAETFSPSGSDVTLAFRTRRGDPSVYRNGARIELVSSTPSDADQYTVDQDAEADGTVITGGASWAGSTILVDYEA